jgi:hypothetical protein
LAVLCCSPVWESVLSPVNSRVDCAWFAAVARGVVSRALARCARHRAPSAPPRGRRVGVSVYRCCCRGGIGGIGGIAMGPALLTGVGIRAVVREQPRGLRLVRSRSARRCLSCSSALRPPPRPLGTAKGPPCPCLRLPLLLQGRHRLSCSSALRPPPRSLDSAKGPPRPFLSLPLLLRGWHRRHRRHRGRPPFYSTPPRTTPLRPPRAQTRRRSSDDPCYQATCAHGPRPHHPGECALAIAS